MRFRTYDSDAATIKEWSRQLSILNNGNYKLYPTVENTLAHWKDELNNNIGINTFSIESTPEATINSWREKLNSLFNL